MGERCCCGLCLLSICFANREWVVTYSLLRTLTAAYSRYKKYTAPAFGVIELSRFDHIRRQSHVRSRRSVRRAAVRGELKKLVQQTVEDTLNALFEEEANDLVD